MVYAIDGAYKTSIPLTLNANGIKSFKNKFFLFVLGDANVIHLLDEKGKNIARTLAKKQALRLCKSNPFVQYQSDNLLFPLGRSNDILMYNADNEDLEKPKVQSKSVLQKHERHPE